MSCIGSLGWTGRARVAPIRPTGGSSGALPSISTYWGGESVTEGFVAEEVNDLGLNRLPDTDSMSCADDIGCLINISCILGTWYQAFYRS